MSYVKKYDVGNIRLDAPYAHFIYELPLLSFGDVQHTVCLSLTFQSKMMNNPYNIANGFALNLNKKLITYEGVAYGYESGDGESVVLNPYYYTKTSVFKDDSQRIVRNIDGKFILENPDYSTESFDSTDNIKLITDKYANKILEYTYSGSRLTSIAYRPESTNKKINFDYNASGMLNSISYCCGTTIVCTTNIEYLNNGGIKVQHYSGVDYYVIPTDTTFTVYSRDYGITELTNYCHSLNCSIATDAAGNKTITSESKIGNTVVDSKTYYYHSPQDNKINIVDVTDFYGVSTRTQFLNDKPAYSYEIPTTQFIDDGTENIVFNGDVSIYSNGEIAGKQTINDGMKMKRTDGNNVYKQLFHSSDHMAGIFAISGWVKGTEGQTSCEIEIRDSFYPEYMVTYPIDNLIPGIWTYFSFAFRATNPRDLSAVVNIPTAQLQTWDFRLTLSEPIAAYANYHDHLTKTEDLLFNTNGDQIPFSTGLSFYNGNSHLDSDTYSITSNDILKYIINQKYGTYKNEIYYNNCKGVITNAASFTVQYVDNGNTITCNIENIGVGKAYYKGSNVYVTKTFIETNENSIQLVSTSSKNGSLSKTIRYDGHLDVISSQEGDIVLTIYRDENTGLITKETHRSTESEETILQLSTYDGSKTQLLTTTDEFGTVTTYTTDQIWGVITAVALNDGTNVTDTFDGDMSTMLTRTFGDSTDESKVHTFTYSDTNPNIIGLASGPLNYGFTYSAGNLTGVSKNGTTIETHALSNNNKTLNSYYPSSNNPIYSVEQKTDNYGRTTEITGFIRNTYNINPTYSEDDGFSILTNETIYGDEIDISSGSSKLATSTDLTNGNVTKYAYEKNRVSRIGVFNSAGTKISEEILAYDGANRVTCIECDMINSGSSIKETVTYATQPTDSITDERVQAYSFLRNNVTMVSSENTYDELKRLSKKTITVGSNVITKDFAYEYTRPSGITHFRNGTAFHNYLWDCDAQLRTTTEHDYVSGGYTNTYVYDSYGRLERENNQVINQTICYTYDSIGNITKAQYYSYTTGEISGSPTSEDAYSYDTSIPDKLISFKGKNISYDDNGYVKSYNGWTYTWSKDRLTKMTSGTRTDGLYTYTFSYNAKGQRTAKTYSYFPGTIYQPDYLSRETVSYEYDPTGRLVGETRLSTHIDSGTTVRKLVYLYEGSEMVGVIYTKEGVSATYYYDKNHRGDVIALLDSTGTAVVKYKYDAWGNCNRYASSNVDLAYVNPIRYRSYYYDESIGLYFLNARYYNPQWRRFISPDDSSYLDPETPNGLNLYAYCNNDPVNYVDPSGHGVIETILDVISVGLSFYDFLNNPSWKNAGWLALDVAFFFIPFIPAVSRLAKGASNIDNVVDVAHGFTKIDNLQDAIVIGNLPERVKAVAEIQGALFYPGYKPIEILESLGRTADITWSMELMARIDNSKWLIDKVWKGYKILDIGKDSRSYFKSILSFYGMEQRLLFYMRNFGKIRFLGYYLTRMIRQK